MSRSPSGGSHLTLEGGQFLKLPALFFFFIGSRRSRTTGAGISGAGAPELRGPAYRDRALPNYRAWAGLGLSSLCRFGVMTRSGAGAPELQSLGATSPSVGSERLLRTRAESGPVACRFGAPAPDPFGSGRSRTTEPGEIGHLLPL